MAKAIANDARTPRGVVCRVETSCRATSETAASATNLRGQQKQELSFQKRMGHIGKNSHPSPKKLPAFGVNLWHAIRDGLDAAQVFPRRLAGKPLSSLHSPKGRMLSDLPGADGNRIKTSRLRSAGSS